MPLPTLFYLLGWPGSVSQVCGWLRSGGSLSWCPNLSHHPCCRHNVPHGPSFGRTSCTVHGEGVSGRSLRRLYLVQEVLTLLQGGAGTQEPAIPQQPLLHLSFPWVIWKQLRCGTNFLKSSHPELAIAYSSPQAKTQEPGQAGEHFLVSELLAQTKGTLLLPPTLQHSLCCSAPRQDRDSGGPL